MYIKVRIEESQEISMWRGIPAMACGVMELAAIEGDSHTLLHKGSPSLHCYDEMKKIGEEKLIIIIS